MPGTLKQVLRKGDKVVQEFDREFNQHYIKVEREVNGIRKIVTLRYRKPLKK